MILGSFSFQSEQVQLFEQLFSYPSPGGLVFHSYVTGGFSGGFYLNSRLPLSPDDFLFTDLRADTEVLMWGTVYNRQQLLADSGLSVTISDPGLVSTLFTREGPGFVRQLNGDFAIFIRQPAARKAYLFRDHIGIRPLAWAATGGTVFFSSDAPGLCRALNGGKDLDTGYLTSFFRYTDLRLTPCINVQKVLPGHYIEFSDNGAKDIRYWSPATTDEDRSMTHRRLLEEIGMIAEDAVRIRCDDRYTAGAHVSGGIDSGFVASLARRGYSHQADFPGYSWSPGNYDDKEPEKTDERDLVRSFCKTTGLRPVFSQMTQEDFHRFIISISDNHGVFSEKHTVEQAVSDGVNLIFSGWGGDEFISTGAAAIESDLLMKFRLRLFFSRNPVIPIRRFLKRILYCVVLPAAGILDKPTARGLRDDARYLKQPFRKSDRKAVSRFHFNISRRSHHLGMLEFYHLQHRCESWAVNGYIHGVEYRYPLLDRRIVEYMLRVPSVQLCNGGHYRPLLREIGNDILPPEVRWNYSKSDPVYRSFMNKLSEDAAAEFMDDVSGWKNYPDLHFIDFTRLEEDISKYRAGMPGVDARVLFRAIVYMKAVHDFSVRYRG